MQDLLKLETRAESLLNVRLIYLVVEYTFSRGYAKNPIIGLMFLLTLALRLFTLMEFVVRRQLHQDADTLPGLYAGNPKRSTTRPSAEHLLAAFGGITRYFHCDGSSKISPLSPSSKRS